MVMVLDTHAQMMTLLTFDLLTDRSDLIHHACEKAWTVDFFFPKVLKLRDNPGG